MDDNRHETIRQALLRHNITVPDDALQQVVEELDRNESDLVLEDGIYWVTAGNVLQPMELRHGSWRRLGKGARYANTATREAAALGPALPIFWRPLDDDARSGAWVLLRREAGSLPYLARWDAAPAAANGGDWESDRGEVLAGTWAEYCPLPPAMDRGAA